jgi:hypothetical protein
MFQIISGNHAATQQQKLAADFPSLYKTCTIFQNCLLATMDHLSRVTAQSARNKMNSQNLSICFAPVLMLDFSQGQPVATNISEPIQVSVV